MRRRIVHLADPDTAKAYRAVSHLSAAPADTIALLRAHLKPVDSVEKKRIEQAIAALDDAFAVREKATKQLAKWGELAEPALRRTLSGQQTLEMRCRRGSTTSAAGGIRFIVSRLEARETMNRSPRSAPCHG